LFETGSLENYVADDELVCTDPELRAVERAMLWRVRHAEEVGDDIVVEPRFRVYWDISASDFGVHIGEEHAVDSTGAHLAYHFTNPIQSPDDVKLLRQRTFSVDRARTQVRAARLNGIFGDILPVHLHGTGPHWSGLLRDIFRLLGNERLLLWPYDAPEAVHAVMSFLRDDRLAYYRWLESESLLGLNHDGWELIGSGSPGYTDALPAKGFDGQARIRDVWYWMEGQEVATVSPAMLSKFFLPYMADLCREFGLVYYGCCEPLHDRWDRLIAAIPNIRCVSVSPWSNQQVMAAKLGKQFVYSRKPKPWPISGPAADWDAVEADLAETIQTARDCNLEIIARDVYRIADRAVLKRWSSIIRGLIG
jgi:hypothetical protein